MAVQKEITINAPAEQVFNYLADISRHSEWSRPGHRLEIEKTSEGAIGPGTSFRSVGHQFGRNEDTVTITEYVPSQRLVYQAEGSAGLIRHSFELAPADGGVRVTKGFEALKPKFPFSLFLPIVSAFVLPGAIEGDLRRIKEKLESAPS